MVKLNIEKKLKEMKKSIYWLSFELDITYNNTHKMVKNKTSSIKFEVIEKLCYIFDCTPNDLFLFTDEESSNKYKK